MSEQILERSSATHSGPDTPSGSAPPRRRFLIPALAVVAGLVLGGLALTMLSPGSDDPAELATAAPGVSAGSAAGQSGQASSGQASGEAASGQGSGDEQAAMGSTTPARSTTRLTSRDPFALLVAKKPAAAPEKAASSGTSGTSGTSGSSGSEASASTPATGATISALKISPLGNSASLKLDGKKYEVDEGETFAKSYRLYDIFNANCAGFLYGDRNAVVCEGDSVRIG